MIRPENIKIKISKLEKAFIKFSSKNRFKIYLYFFIVTFLSILRALPYVNLIFDKNFLNFLIIAIFLLIFNISLKHTVYMCIILFLLSAPLLIFGDISSADLLGNYIYGFLVIVVVKAVWEYNSSNLS